MYLLQCFHTSRSGIAGQLGGIRADYHPIICAVCTAYPPCKSQFHHGHGRPFICMTGSCIPPQLGLSEISRCSQKRLSLNEAHSGGFLAGVSLVSGRPVWQCRIPQALPGCLHPLCMSNQTGLPGKHVLHPAWCSVGTTLWLMQFSQSFASKEHTQILCCKIAAVSVQVPSAQKCKNETWACDLEGFHSLLSVSINRQKLIRH